MTIKKRINLENTIFYVEVECSYKNKNGFTRLCLVDGENDNYDGGDLSILIEKIENNYEIDKVREKYGCEISFLADCLYIYDNIPFLSGISDCYISSKDNLITSTAYITKEEMDNYIKENNIVMKNI